MTDLSHLAYEERKLWEKLDHQMRFIKEGEGAAQRGESPKTCPYEVEAGRDTRRRWWCDGYRGAVTEILALQYDSLTHKERWSLIKRGAWCRRQEVTIHTAFTALVFRSITRTWNNLIKQSAASLTILLMGVILCSCTLPTEVVNYRTYTDPSKGIYYIYDGVMDNGVLISDVGGSQTRVYITRQTQ